MRLLVDNNLSPRLCQVLADAGWDAAHVRSLGLRSATDQVGMEEARSGGRVLVSADTDFGALLAASHASKPSIVLVRRVAGRRVEELAGLLLANLPVIADDLDAGCVAVIEDASMRIRPLPI